MATTTFVQGNNINTTLASAASNTMTTLTLSSSANLPTLANGQQMVLTLNDAAMGAIYEVVYATGITGATLNVLRGQEGTTAQNWSIDDFAFCAPTAGTVAQVNGNPANQFQTATATAANQAVPLSQAQAMRGTFNGAYSFNASTTLTAAQAGSIVYFYGSTASQVLTLPAASALSPGQGYTISNFATVPVSVVRSGVVPATDTILVGTGASQVVLQPGDDLEITAANNSQWVATGSSVRQFSPLMVGGLSGAGAVGVVGSVRDLSMIVASASATATMTADEIIVESALGGTAYKLASFNKTINLAGTGAGGMDTGSAPASGFVAIYAIYNPASNTSALLATNATSVVAPNVYGGSNMPSGYSASALVSVRATNGSGLLLAGAQRDRDISVGNIAILSTTGGPSTPTALASTAMPKNAIRAKGYYSFSDSVAATVNLSVYSDSAGSDQCTLGLTSNAGSFGIAGSWDVLISNQQNIFWSITASAGAPTVGISLDRYSI